MEDNDVIGGSSNCPWEKRGVVRRDCKPHRGLLLLVLGSWGYLSGIFAMFPTWLIGINKLINPGMTPGFWQSRPPTDLLLVIIVTAVLLLVGFLLSLTVWVLSRKDLAAMAAGKIDPEGAERTRMAMRCGRIGLFWFGLNAAFWTLLVLF